MKQKDFEKLLRSDDLAGKIIKFSAVFESRLDIVLMEYFAARETEFEFYEHIISRLSLFHKLNILESINLGKGLKSRDNIIISMSGIRKLRNALAHNYHLGDHELKKLYSNQYIRNLINDYPKSLSDEKRNLETRFTYLWKAANKLRNT